RCPPRRPPAGGAVHVLPAPDRRGGDRLGAEGLTAAECGGPRRSAQRTDGRGPPEPAGRRGGPREDAARSGGGAGPLRCSPTPDVAGAIRATPWRGFDAQVYNA